MTDAKQEKVKKRKKRETEDLVNQSRHSSATNTAPDAGEGVVNAGVEETSEEKREWRKKRKTSGPDEGASIRVKNEKKKRRRKTDDDLDRADSQAELPDPSADEGLSEKARNGVSSFAVSRDYRVHTIIFSTVICSKEGYRIGGLEIQQGTSELACQTFLVRECVTSISYDNFLPDSLPFQIPDKYVTIVTKYLCGCQGAVRNVRRLETVSNSTALMADCHIQGLIDGCRRVLSASTPVEESAPLEANDPVDGTEKTSGLPNRPIRIPITDVSRARAERLLAILEK